MGQSERRSWIIEWGGEATLTVDEIWPNGDAPENPTRDDVIAQIAKEGNPRSFARNWNCDIEGVEVDGRPVRF